MNRFAVVVACAVVVSCAGTPGTPVHRPAPRAPAPPMAVASDVVFAIDMSKSMIETDVSPSRLEATKLALRRFVANDTVDRIGVVIFSQQGKRLSALDAARTQLDQAIASLRLGDVPELGTGIGDGLAVAVDEVRSGGARRQAVVLISDGDYNWATHFDPDQATAAAKGVGVVVHTVLIANDRPDGTPTTNPALMEHIAITTGGSFYRATDATTLDRALDDIQAKLRAEG